MFLDSSTWFYCLPGWYKWLINFASLWKRSFSSLACYSKALLSEEISASAYLWPLSAYSESKFYFFFSTTCTCFSSPSTFLSLHTYMLSDSSSVLWSSSFSSTEKSLYWGGEVSAVVENNTNHFKGSEINCGNVGHLWKNFEMLT